MTTKWKESVKAFCDGCELYNGGCVEPTGKECKLKPALNAALRQKEQK